MSDKILLNKDTHSFSESDLPCLVTYAEKSGGSHFTITMVVDLFFQGSKILFLTAYPMAKDNFLQQINDYHSKIAFVNSVYELEKVKDTQVIILESGNEALFIEAVEALTDLEERVILIKNIEVFSKAVFNICLSKEKVILSGNLDECSDKERISHKIYKTIIAFTKPETSLPIEVPVLEKYTGYMVGNNKSGIVQIEKK